MNRVRFPVAAISLTLCALGALAQDTGTTQVADTATTLLLVPGIVTTVNASSAAVSVFSDKEDVFFTAGPTTSPCAFTQFVPDGRYYFQVTDLSGTRLLSSDPLTERVVTVRNGVLAAYNGTTHATQAQGPCGALAVGVAPFRDAGNLVASYLLWLTPAARLEGDPTQIDPVCGSGCFHGFRPEFSLTTSFRVEDKRFCEDTFCVSGVKFEDRNGNGVRDSGEPGLPGVEIRASDVDDTTRAPLRGLTSPDGTFQVCGLERGTDFRIIETVPFGYQQTAPLDRRLSRRLIALDRGYFVEGCDENFSGLAFGNQLIPNAIGGIKFEDLNANGVRDPGEPGLAGFTITLTPATPGAPPLQTAVTDANGNFLFTNVPPGNYLLSETQRQGFSLTLPALNSIAVTLASGGSSIDNTFGNFRGVLTGSITGTKFLDLNGNGVRDAGEPGLAGVTITRTASVNDAANATLSVVTDAQGNFTFANVPFGAFTLTETPPPGFTQTAPAAPGTISANVNFAQRTSSGSLFGNRLITGSIAGVKFNDLNGNGVRDAGEPGLSGVTISRTSSPNDVTGATLSVLTGADGSFVFNAVPLGIYTLRETVPAGFVQTVPGGAGTISVTISESAPNSTGNLFGNRQAGGVSGTKFNDLNGNGVRDAGEPGLSGVTIRLTDAAGTVRTATTDASGNFAFTGIPAGTYTVAEVLPTGFHQTAPAAPGTFSATITATTGVSGLLFGNQANPSGAGTITGRKILDLNGNGVLDGNDRGFEGIVFELRDMSGNLIASATSNANGDFTFSNIPLGTYVLSEILPPNFFQTFPGTQGFPGTFTITLTSAQPSATGFLFLNKC